MGRYSSVGIATGWTVRDRIPVGARFSPPVQTGPGAHPASCAMGTGSFPGVKSGRGVTLTPHPLLVPWSTPPMGRTACTEPQCLYKGALFTLANPATTSVCWVTLQKRESQGRRISRHLILEWNLHFCPGFKSPFLIFDKSYIREKRPFLNADYHDSSNCIESESS